MTDSTDAVIGRIENTVVKHAWFGQGLKAIERCLKAALAGHDQRGVIIYGDSGAGKSTLAKYFSSKHPRSRLADGLRIPVLLATVPSKPTANILLTELLEELGDPMPDSGTLKGKTQRFLKLVKKVQLKVLILDEFQHFVDQGSYKVQHAVADWLKVQIEKAKINLVVLGLERCTQVFETNEQLKRRFRAPVKLPRFDWRIAEQRHQFRLILAQMQRSVAPLSLPDLSSEELAFRCFCATGGLIGRLANLLIEVAENSQETGRQAVTLEDLDQAAHHASYDLPLGLERPFSRDLPVTPTEEIIKAALALGTKDDEPPQATKPATNRRASASAAIQRRSRSDARHREVFGE